MARTTTVTHPDGTVSKRTSKTRTYAYAVVEGPLDPQRYADFLEAGANESEAKADAIEAALADPHFNRRSRGVGPRNTEDPDQGYSGEHTYHNFEAYLVGTAISWHCDSKARASFAEDWAFFYGYTPEILDTVVKTYANGYESRSIVVDVRPYLLGVARHDLENLRASVVKTRETVARLRSGDTSDISNGNGYGVLRWSSREDLAYKALAEFDYSVAMGHTLSVVAVDPEV